MNNKRRNERKAYFQQADQAPMDPNTENNPEKLGYPGEVGYKNQPMAVPVGEDSRPWEQRWFESAANKTKQVMGPKGSEFDLKKEWQRLPSDAKVANAKVSMGFKRTAKPQDSNWNIYLTNKKGEKETILTATLAEIWGKKLNEKYANMTATKEYATEVLGKIKELGFANVAYLLTGNDEYVKKAQAEKGTVKTAQPLDMAVVESPAMGASPIDEGSDLGTALDAEVNTTADEADVTVDLLAQKHEELETAQGELVENTAPETTVEVFTQLQDAERMVDEAKEEMSMASSRLRDKTVTAAQKIKLIRVVAEAMEDAVDTLSGSDDVLERAKSAVDAADIAIEAASEVAGGGEMVDEISVDEVPMEGAEAPVDAPVEEAVSIDDALANFEGKTASSYVSKFLAARAEKRSTAGVDDNPGEQGKYGVVPEGAPKDGEAEIASAHPNGGAEVTNLTAGGKPKDNGDRFETEVEAQAADLAVVNKMPSGNLNGSAGDPNTESSIKSAVKTASGKDTPGGVDQETKNFWAKDLWGQAEGDQAAKDFGKALYQDFASGGNSAKASLQAAVDERVAKVVQATKEETAAKTERAYTLADVAVNKGFCERTADARSEFVKEVLAFDDASFISFKKRIEAAPDKVSASTSELVRTASAKLPNVGQVNPLADMDAVSKDEVSILEGIGWS